MKDDESEFDMDINLSNITCRSRFISFSELVALQDTWVTLEELVSPAFFLRWSWIYAWGTMQQDKDMRFCLTEAIIEDTTVGLALFNCKSVSPLPFVKLNQLWLHRHGEVNCDQIWMEHNDVLALPEHSQRIRQAMFKHLLASDSMWHEIYVGMADTSVLQAIESEDIKKRIIIASPAFRVDLTQHVDLASYLSVLSKNTRAQVAKSERNITSHGEITLELASSLSEKQTFLSQIAQKHIKRWGHTIHGSGFSNQIFIDFHYRLILQDTENKNCRLYRLCQNGEALGYVYLLTTAHTWYFYLSAISFHKDPKIKVGLLLHTLIIEQAIEAGVHYYDFMAGEAQYKRSLSNSAEYSQQLVCFYRPTAYIIVREQIRKLKAWFKQKINKNGSYN